MSGLVTTATPAVAGCRQRTRKNISQEATSQEDFVFAQKVVRQEDPIVFLLLTSCDYVRPRHHGDASSCRLPATNQEEHFTGGHESRRLRIRTEGRETRRPNSLLTPDLLRTSADRLHQSTRVDASRCRLPATN